MLLSLSLLSVILSILLVCFNFRTLAFAKYLGGFFLLLSLYGLVMHALLYSKSVWLVSIFFVNIGFLAYLIGPMLFWYVRGVLTDRARLKKSDLWHLLPMLIYLIGVVPYLIKPFSYKTEIAARLVADANFIGSSSKLFIFHTIPASVIYLGRPIIVLGYLFWAVGIFFIYLRKNKVASVPSQQRFMITWLSILLGFLFVLTVGHMLQIVQSVILRNMTHFYGLTFINGLAGIGLAGVLISPFFFPAILYGLPRVHQPVKAAHPLGRHNVNPRTADGGKPAVESEYLSLIGQKIELCMEKNKPHLKHDCNLTHLSEMIKIPVHHLAYYFREIRKQSFNDYRNQLRVDHAKRLIQEGKASAMSLEGIGLSSGFASRKTFYNAFLKYEHLSPSAFLAHHTQI